MSVENGDYQRLRDEAFKAVEAIGERYFTVEALEGCIKDFARHIYDLTDLLMMRDATIALLNTVAHDAWHLLDDGGEVPGDPDGFEGMKRDADRLSESLDLLEAGGWDPHPEDHITTSPTPGSQS